MHRDPAVECLVEEPHQHLYSSARAVAGLPSMLKLETFWGKVIAEPVPPEWEHGDNLGTNG